MVENLLENNSQLFGRTEHMTSVILDGKKNDIGKVLKVKIDRSNSNTLFGKIINNSIEKVA